MDFLWLFLKCLWWILPAGVANMAPVLVKNKFKFLAKPVDFNLRLRGKPILGKSKTWRGLIIGTCVGTLIFLIQQWLYRFPVFERMSLINYHEISFFYGFLLALGALLGDIIKSFLKRRLDIAPGKTWFPFDQIDWIIGALAFSIALLPLPWLVWLTAIILGMALHFLSNFVGIVLKLKNSY